MEHCEHCLSFLKKCNLHSTVDLSRSFVKIDNKLHLGIDREIVCPILTRYKPEIIVLAGNGAVQATSGESCWKILENGFTKAGLIGEKKYKDPLDALTWLAAHYDFFSKTIDSDQGFENIKNIKRDCIIQLKACHTVPSAMYCHACDKEQSPPDFSNTLYLTTNWDLGIFKRFPNVIQLHGRCDYPDEAILPLQNISKLMAQSKEDFERLNAGILPGPFIDRCLRITEGFIFWGTGLNDYDAALWHFLSGFLAKNNLVKIGVTTRNNPKSIQKANERVMRFFPQLQPSECLCNIISKKP